MISIIDNTIDLGILWLQQHEILLIGGAILLLLLAVSAYKLIPAAARLGLRLIHKQPKELQKKLIELLSGEALVELYEPSNRYVESVPEGKKPRINAWLSPYARAVKASVKRRGRLPQNQIFQARRQVREAAKHIQVRPLTDEEKVLIDFDNENPFNQFAIVLQFDGHDPRDFERFYPGIKSQLGLQDLEVIPDENPRAVTLLASTVKLEDALVGMRHSTEFFEEHPAKSCTSLPMAATVDGKVWALPTHHSFIYGTTGSGKSGPLISTIVQLTPFVEKGIVKLYGIDPKAADIRVFETTNLFEKIATETDDAIALINEIHSQMNLRSRNVRIDLEKGETGQAFEATKKTPWVVLLIDELFALRQEMIQSKEGKASWTNLEKILAKGRSTGFFVIGASQFADMENLKQLRPNFTNVIVLRQPSAYLNDLFLGETAKANGFDSTAIPASNKANGYKYSGIGFVVGEGGGVEKVRFAHLPKAALIEFLKKHRAKSTALPEELEPLKEDTWGEDLPPLEG